MYTSFKWIKLHLISICFYIVTDKIDSLIPPSTVFSLFDDQCHNLPPLTLDLQRTIPKLSPWSTSLMISVPLYRIWINPTFINGVYYSDSPLSLFAWKAGIPNNKILAPPLIEGVKMASGFWAEDAELVWLGVYPMNSRPFRLMGCARHLLCCPVATATTNCGLWAYCPRDQGQGGGIFRFFGGCSRK